MLGFLDKEKGNCISWAIATGFLEPLSAGFFLASSKLQGWTMSFDLTGHGSFRAPRTSDSGSAAARVCMEPSLARSCGFLGRGAIHDVEILKAANVAASRREYAGSMAGKTGRFQLLGGKPLGHS